MVTIRLLYFLLVLVFLRLRDASAYTHQDMKNNLAAYDIGAGSSLEVEQFGGEPTAAEDENTVLGGRKMMVKRVLEKEKTKEQGSNEEDSAISGKQIYVLKKRKGNSRKQYLKDENAINRRLLKSKTYSAGEEISGRDTSIQSSMLISNSSSKDKLGGSPISEKPVLQNSNKNDSFHQNLEFKKLLDSANELLKLMNKDYPGHGGGSHKPPINNNEPFNQEHVIAP